MFFASREVVRRGSRSPGQLRRGVEYWNRKCALPDRMDRGWRHMYVGFTAFRGSIVLTSAPAPKELPGRREVEKLSDETLFWRLVHETYFFRCLRPSLLIRPVCIAGNLCLAFYPLRNDPLFGGMSTCRGREREREGGHRSKGEGGRDPASAHLLEHEGNPAFLCHQDANVRKKWFAKSEPTAAARATIGAIPGCGPRQSRSTD